MIDASTVRKLLCARRLGITFAQDIGEFKDLRVSFRLALTSGAPFSRVL